MKEEATHIIYRFKNQILDLYIFASIFVLNIEESIA